MKVSIIGTGDLDTISKYAKVSLKELNKLMKNTAKLLVSIDAEVIILPARGVPYEFAKLYRKLGGRKVIGIIPARCPFYGKYTPQIIGPFMDVIDERFEVDSWYDVNGNIATLGDYTICFGLSAGVMGEISLMKYNLKYRGSRTKLVIFEQTISKKLQKEVEVDIKPVYISSVNQLKKILV